MKRRILLSLLLLVSLCLTVRAYDTLTVTQKILLEQSVLPMLHDQAWQNCAIRFNRRTFGLTTICLKGDYDRRGRAALSQQGNEEKHFRAEVCSFVIPNAQSRLFGGASYRNGRRENVLWNENSDYALLYPYVTGDSIGGFMKEEEYKFAGGYAYRFGDWTTAAELAYRASIGYRDKDPRPRNIVSDLQANVALSRRIGNGYDIGISLRGRTYNQKSEITFLADKGSTSVYQMLGLGMDYVRFAGTQTSFHYTGRGWGGSIELMPTCRQKNNNGFSASLRTDRFHLTKEATGLNSIPINEISQTDFWLETTWTQQQHTREYGIRLLTGVQLRTGRENIFGDPTGNSYPQIGSVNQFGNNCLSVKIQGVAGCRSERGRHRNWTLLPFIGYEQMKSEYKGQARYVKITTGQAGLEAQSMWQTSRWLLSARLNGNYTASLKSNRSLPGLNNGKSAAQALLANIDYLSDNHVSFGLKLRGDYVVDARYTLFLSTEWNTRSYRKCGHARQLAVTMGCNF